MKNRGFFIAPVMKVSVQSDNQSLMCSAILTAYPEGENSIVALDELVSVTLSPRIILFD